MFLLFQIYHYVCKYKSEAIHNKDYSVVKTFRAAKVALFFYPIPLLQKSACAKTFER